MCVTPVSRATMEFTHDSTANANNTCYQGLVRIAPAEVVEIFGEPEAGDEYKITMEYTFKGEDGSIVTLYDWKSTSLYDEDNPSPDEWRVETHPEEFHVGGHDSRSATLFMAWLHHRRLAHIRSSAPESPRDGCPECNGTRKYVGFRGFEEPCRSC